MPWPIMIRMTTPTDADEEAKLIAYATEFVRGYSETLDKHYADVKGLITEAGLGSAFFPLYRRKLAKDMALAALFTPHDFYLFFLDEPYGTAIKVWEEAGDGSSFNR